MWKNPLVIAALAGILTYVAIWWYTNNYGAISALQGYEDDNKFLIPVVVAVVAFFGCKWYCGKNLDTVAYGSEGEIDQISIVPLK